MLSFIITNKRKLLQAGLLAFSLIFLLSPLVVFGAYHLVFRNKIYPYVKIASKPVSGLTLKEAQARIAKKIAQEQKEEITFEFEDKSWILKLKELRFFYKPEETVEKSFLLGRDASFLENLEARWQLWRHSKNLPLQLSFNQLLFEEKVATLSGLLDKPAIPPQIKISQNQVIVEKGVPGRQLKVEKLRSQLTNNLGRLNFSAIKLPAESVYPEITDQMAENTRALAEKLLNKKIKLVFQTQIWNLEDEELINFLDFENGFDEKKIKNYVDSLAENIDRPPQNALFNFQNGRVIEFKPAQDGQTLEKEKTYEAMKKTLEELAKEEKSAEINLQVILSKPEVKTEEVNNLGIRELVGQGVSFFRGSAASRVANIQLASSRLNGLLVKPGETFSFNQSLGEVSKETGFKEAWVIKEGKTVLGDGGGVCQVSTTLFRAALNSGLPIEERQAHAYRVYYYEQSSQVGLDATVFEPHPDLKFKNDTQHHILIQSAVNTYAQKLSFYLYGTSDGRQVFISQSRIWDQAAPPPDKYIDDPNLPVGTIKQIDFKAWGAKASFDWKVTRGNEVLQERTFYSYYRPWQAVFLRGTR